jgi:dienelactone hydrolase
LKPTLAVKYLLAILVSTALISPAFCQHRQQYIGGYSVFTIPFKGDSITFAVVAKKGELKQRKPIFLFRQGSLPIPLFTINPKNNRPSLTELPITCYDHEAEYYSIMIAKPGVPLVVSDSYLDTLFNTRSNPKPEMYPVTYLAHNYLDYYVDQTNAVLNFVLSQPWADSKRVVLTGGSEGYHVAIKTAYTNKQVTHLIAFSGGLEGRQQSIIRQERMKGYTGEYTQEEAQRSVEARQQQWAAICQDSLSVTATSGDPNRTTYSFSHGHNKDFLLALTIPICIVYGTADVGSTSNDCLPLEFARRGKTNLTLRAYPNHDHTFHKLTYDSGGKVIDKFYNGAAVEKDYFEWLSQH